MVLGVALRERQHRGVRSTCVSAWLHRVLRWLRKGCASFLRREARCGHLYLELMKS